MNKSLVTAWLLAIPFLTTATLAFRFHPIPTRQLAMNERSVEVNQMSRQQYSTKLLMGFFDDVLSGAEGAKRESENKKYIEKLQQRVDSINALETMFEECDDDELKAKTGEFYRRLQAGEDIHGTIVEEAFAVVREASWRVLELRHYDVQILGGLILHDGRLAEMATGEGKTLVSTLPIYLNALSGKSAYVITVNDYLARRDMEKMGQIHRFLGLKVGLIQSNMTEEQRRSAYACDVVYVTNSELGFDYLRDHLALSSSQTVLRGGAGEFDSFCVVDEADSVLIDEARTPLIISKQVPAPSNKYSTANELAQALKENVHYKVDLKNKNVVLNDVGYQDCERALGIENLFSIQVDGEAWAPYIVNAVKAKELFNRDVEYTVLLDSYGKESGVGIIDSFTGRILEGRRWSDGLHQSIEAKEGIAVSEQSKVIAKVTYQALFRQFTRLSGMTGTATADAEEFELIYGLKVNSVPTAYPIARRDYPDVAFKTREAANNALIKEVKNVGGGQEGGRPCLIGTTSVAQSELLVQSFAEEGIQAELLNASPKNAPRESEIVAQAGRAGVVTVATNMAGRGTDILLGGCPVTMSRIKTRAILLEEGVLSQDEALTLPPSPIESYFPCSIAEESVEALKDAADMIKQTFGSNITGIDLDEILTVAFDTTEDDEDPNYILKLREAAQVVQGTYRNVLTEEKEVVKKLGGLYVMGTNRHESSRIDQQLRGRAGRQGDPGSSRFFVSFEDDMFVIFGGDNLKKILDTFRVSAEMPIEAQAVTDALNKVQAAVEEKNRSIREEIFRFDEILNTQRELIYKRRRGILFATPAESLDTMKLYNKRTLSDIVIAQTSDEGLLNVEKVIEKINLFFPSIAVKDVALTGGSQKAVIALLTEIVEKTFEIRIEEKHNSGQSYDFFGRSARYVTLVTMDKAWSDHLQAMESMKETVILRQFQGRDPVAEYRSEAFALFNGLEDTMIRDAVFSLWQSLVPAIKTSAHVTQAVTPSSG